jgi:hypothetical protein
MWIELDFENKVLKKIFRPKKDEGSEQLGYLHNEELCDLDRSCGIVR